jgi:hypothetical protein
MAFFSLEVDMEGAVGVHCDLSSHLHGVQVGLVRNSEEEYGGDNSLVQGKIHR